MVAILLNVVLLGGLSVLAAAGGVALKEAVRQRARFRGILLSLGLLVFSLLAIWLILL